MKGGYMKIRRNTMISVALIALIAIVVSCAPTATVTKGTAAPTISQAQAVPYSGPQKRIAVMTFTDKTAKGWRGVGEGMSDMLTSALFESGRFIVLERQAVRDVIQEQDLGASGRVKRETAAPIGEIEGAELMVYGAVTEFEPEEAGIGGGTYIPGLKTGVIAGAKRAHVAIDLRIVDSKTSRIVATTTVVGKATDVAGGIGTVIGGGKTRMPIGLAGYKNTPMEQAIRNCIDQAVNFISSKAF
jgi:curli biogenesis system outer membrane secretion channel CsgG